MLAITSYKKISEVFNGESPIDQCTEHLTLTDILKIKHGPIVSCDVQFSQNVAEERTCLR